MYVCMYVCMPLSVNMWVCINTLSTSQIEKDTLSVNFLSVLLWHISSLKIILKT